MSDFDALPFRCVHKRYIGSDPTLKGKIALARTDVIPRLGQSYVQFNDVTIPQAFGWHTFNDHDFEEVPNV